MTSANKGWTTSDEPSGHVDVIFSQEKLIPGELASFTARDPKGLYRSEFTGKVSHTGCSIDGSFKDNAGSLLENGPDRVDHAGPQTLFWYGATDYWVKVSRK
jgi:hypothetical protein